MPDQPAVTEEGAAAILAAPRDDPPALPAAVAGPEAPVAGPQTAWRRATPGDIPAINRIEAQVHTFAPERPEVWHERMTLFGDGTRMLANGDEVLGYGCCYPWRLGEVPSLDALLGALPPRPDCLYVHDVALLPAGRRRRFGASYVAYAANLARSRGLTHLALVSVYGTTGVWGRFGFELATPRSSQALAIYGDTARYMVATLAEPGLA